MTYTTVRCMRCHVPWTGFGMICNECKQIENLEKLRQQQAAASKPTQNYSNSGSGNLDWANSIEDLDRFSSSSDFSWPLPLRLACWAIFIWVLSWGDWAIASILWTMVKAAAYMMFGFWFGASPASFGL